MKKQDKVALKSKTVAELTKLVGELEAQRLKATMEKFAGKLANTSLVKTLSDDLARVKTARRLLELATAKAEPPIVEKKTEKKTEKKATKTPKKRTTKKASKKA